MPDEQFAELRAAHAKATPGKLRSVGFRLSHEANRNIDSTVFHLDEIGQIGSGPYQAIPFARREDAEWHAAVHNSFQELIAALDQARAERDALRREASQVDEQLAWIEENGETYTKEALLDFIRRARQDSEPTEVLAARDARLKREGAAEWLEANNERLDTMNRADVEAEVVKLRQGGE